MTSEVEKVLDKVRKLVALAYGGATEAEAETALQRAHDLLARYNMSMDDVVEQGEATSRAELDSVSTEEQVGRYNEHWRKVCMMAAAELYFCRYIFAKTRVPGKNSARTQTGIRHMFVGKPHNAAVARMMGEYLQTTVTRLANDGAREYFGKPTSAERNRFHRNFNLGCASRLYERAQELRRLAEQGEAQDSEGNNLPALLSMYQHERSLADRYIEEKFGKLKTSKSQARPTDGDIYTRGRRAGNDISLSTQVAAGRPHKKIGGH